MAPPQQKVSDDQDLIPSDSEDEDFQLPGGDAGSDSDDSDSDDERPSKRVKVAAAPVEPVLTKAAVDDLWASFNSGADEDPYAASNTASTSKAVEKPKKIKITVSYDFVGEKITQEKEVLEDSKEAKEWLERQALLKDSAPKATSAAPPSVSTSAIDALFGAESDLSQSTDKTSATDKPAAPPAPAPKPAPKGGPRKKAGGGLGALAASLGKPAKLNTLEKSKLDWNKFVDKEDLSDTLTHARKDGYLDKQDFLGRTEQARDEAWEKNKAGRRGRP